ncbi:MAG: hypothetical protein LBU83_05975 [Bacteroidales bacterium]|jgi:hypothetical protein|nr:hypothetical protein [Bacteroidales bacterium]
MELRFSQRIGKRPIKEILQVENIDVDLKNNLWNTIIDIFKLNDYGGRDHNLLSNHIWATFFKQAKDMVPNKGYYNWLRNWFFEQAEWCEIYDFLEYLYSFYYYCPYRLQELYDYINQKKIDIGDVFNRILEEELSGYRIIDGQISPITDKIELLSISDAVDNSNKWQSVATHLKTSIEFFSDRKNPDYRNSIKESISAVEALCKIIVNNDKATLGAALSEIEKQYGLHGALKTAFSSLYGYTSDSGGIRHALSENDGEATFNEAKFILITCSAFINYLKAQYAK